MGERLLRELFVENVALIGRLRLPLGPGFNVLTGETGTGKSLILDALGLAIGQRAGPSVIRTGQEWARVEASFEIEPGDPVASRLEEMGYPPDDGLLVLSRELSASGRSRCRINGRLVSVGELARAGDLLVDIHTQHESQHLLSPAVQLSLLDAYGGPQALSLAEQVRQAWGALERARAERQRLAETERERMREIDLLRFQIDEIEAAAIEEGEESRAVAEYNRLSHAARLQELLGAARDALSSDGAELGAQAALGDAASRLEEAAALDPDARLLGERVNLAAETVQEIARDIRHLIEQCEPDPDRLKALEERLALFERLKRKYGATIEDVCRYAGEARRRLASLDQQATRATELDGVLRDAEKRYAEIAGALRQLRQDAAEKLARSVEVELRELAMPGACFEVALEPDEPGPRGTERATFQFSANAGERPRPLSQVASGGELSRTMLACRTVLAAASDQAPVLVFDEPDAGLGGRAAGAVGERLARLGRFRQVMVVTHLPQVASMADSHVSVSKLERDGVTQVDVRALSPEERVRELARMLGGTAVTESAERHARELLRLAGQAKAAG